MISSAKPKWWHTSIKTVHNGIKKVDLGLVLLITLPLILLSITRLWLFPRLGQIDSWIYFGYFTHPIPLLNFDNHLFFPDWFRPDEPKPFTPKDVLYQNSRLPWTMAGALVYHLFPPIIANYVLHLSFYYATVLSIYGTLKCTVGQRSGLLSAVLLGTYGYFMISQNWDYVEVAVLAYFSLTVFLLTLATKLKQWRLALFGAGCFYGAMFYSNTGAVLLTPALSTYYLLSNHRYRRNPIFSSIGYSFLGLMGVTLFFSVINYTMTGDLLFFMPAFRYALADAKEGYGYHASPGWFISLNDHHWMRLPLLVGCTSVVYMVWNTFKSWHDRSLTHSLPIFSVTFLLGLLPYVLLELQGKGVLWLIYYASHLIPSTFLAFGEQVSLVVERLNRRGAVGLIVGIVILQILTFRQLLYRMVTNGFSYAATLVDIQKLLYGTVALMATVLAVLLFLQLISSSGRKKLKQLVSLKFILVITLLSFYYCFNFQGLFTLFNSEGGAWNNLLYTSIPEDSMLATIQAQNILKAIDPRGKFLFWFNEAESPTFTMVFSSWLGTSRLISRDFPKLNYVTNTPNSETRIKQLKFQFEKHPSIVLLSQKFNVEQQANTSLASIGFTLNPISTYDIVQGDVHFKMTIIEIIKK